jgi:hypothetical protein
MLQGLEALADDARTRVIVLISKPPSATIASRILDAAQAAGKPVVVHFLGASPGPSSNIHTATSLRHAADIAVALSRGESLPADVPASQATLDAIAARVAAMPPAQRSVRGLFTGGTFCYEAQLAFLAEGLACRSNAAVHGAEHFDGRFDGHVFLDLGDDAYTRGRPHPMIDPMLRNEMLRAQADDASVAALLFDVVLGFGAHPDPAHDLGLALEAAQARSRAQGRQMVLIGHICGTDGDPQDRAVQAARLEVAGATIVGSNVEAARLAARLARS